MQQMEKDERKFSGLLQDYRMTAEYDARHNTRICIITLMYSRQALVTYTGLPGIFSVKQEYHHSIILH